MIDPILVFIGGGFFGIVALIVVMAKVLSSPRFAGMFPNGEDSERIDTSTIGMHASNELDSFVPDSSDSGSDSSDSGSDSSED